MDAPESDDSASVGASESEPEMESPAGRRGGDGSPDSGIHSRGDERGDGGGEADQSGGPDTPGAAGAAGQPGSVRLPKSSYDPAQMASLDVPA